MNTKNFKKLFLFLIITIALLLSICINVKAADNFPDNEIMYLTATVGETYDHVGISYHTSSDNSYILFGTKISNNEIVNPIKVTPISSLWSFKKSDNDSDEYGFSSRYVCKGTLTNLLPQTKYYYQAIDDNVKSKIQSFESLAKDTEPKSFMFLTDIQSVGSSFQNSQNLINAIYEASDIDPNLIVMTGDQVDRGGIEQQWKDYYTYVSAISNTLQANVPGNHEWYTTSGGDYVTNEIYNQMTNNPLNGPEDRIGSSYFFKNGNVLFIMLDIVKIDYDVETQQNWFRNVVKNNPSKWIIVGSHPGMYSTGIYKEDAKIMRRNWLSVFEECQVDLALNGHEHIYSRKNLRYGGLASSTTAGPVDEALGVTYLQGGAAGLKLYSAQNKEDYDYLDYYTNNTGVVITIDGDELNVKRYKASGVVDDEFTLYAKRPDEITPISDDEILNSFTVNYDEDTSAVTINWSGSIYGNAKNINIKGGNLKGEGIDIPVVTSSLDSKTWKGYYNSYNYYFAITITKNDGSTLTKNLELILNKNLLDYKINYVLDDGTNHPDNPSTFKGIDLPLNLETFLKSPTKPGYLFKGWKLNDGNRIVKEVDLDELDDITLTAVWEIAPFYITYELNGGQNNIANKLEVYKEDLPKRLYSAKKDGDKFIGWQLNGEFVTEIPDTITGDITLIAIWASTNNKTYNITYKLNDGTNNSSNPSSYEPGKLPIKLNNPTKKKYEFKGWLLNGEIVTEIPSDISGDIVLEATWSKAKGCKKSIATEIIICIEILSSTILIFRKKH